MSIIDAADISQYETVYYFNSAYKNFKLQLAILFSQIYSIYSIL